MPSKPFHCWEKCFIYFSATCHVFYVPSFFIRDYSLIIFVKRFICQFFEVLGGFAQLGPDFTTPFKRLSWSSWCFYRHRDTFVTEHWMRTEGFGKVGPHLISLGFSKGTEGTGKTNLNKSLGKHECIIRGGLGKPEVVAKTMGRALKFVCLFINYVLLDILFEFKNGTSSIFGCMGKSQIFSFN